MPKDTPRRKTKMIQWRANPGPIGYMSYTLSLSYIETKRQASYLATTNPLPDDKILDWSKLKQIADDILKCIKNEK